MTTTAHDTAIRLAVVEQWLDQHDIAWTLDTVDLGQVDHVAGLANQTRLDALNADAVARYTADMEGGATFPPVILRRAGERWLPVDGNHRLASARAAGRRNHSAYLIDELTAAQAHELAIAANRTHGLPLTDEERLWHALHLVHDDGVTIEQAAAAVGITADRLSRRLAVEKFTKRAVHLQMNGWADLSETNRHILQALKDDMVFRRATRLAQERRVLAAEVPPLVARLNSLTTTDALDVLSEIDRNTRGIDRRGVGRPPSAATSPRKRLMGDLDTLVARFTPRSVADDCTTNQAREQTSRQIKAAARHLMKIEKELWR